MKEWNIHYAVYDGLGDLCEYAIVLPNWWKVLWWFIRKGHRYCRIYIWTSNRLEDENEDA